VARTTRIGGALGNADDRRGRCIARGFGANAFALRGREGLRLSIMFTLGVGSVEGAPSIVLLTQTRKHHSNQIMRVGSLEHLGQPVKVRP